ncbi:hypothetical protein KVR01_001336 [Diaporthe batatas]|uniref:uncharacterized protein n=1 Tax=Diaporthe batatas TaxID=748121 RepID=UPI001D05B6B1|nr:uncharacterized protein KVR01_001336 [Diaporthe batatas]KAG8168587.1 hypothetical protein KVR01_001336 [Diaporthe batatas]
MAIDSEEFLHLARPIAPAAPGFNTNISPMTVNLQPQAILSILDHAIRRDDTAPEDNSPDAPQPRVIGALIGVRSEDGTEVEVRNTFAIPHVENEEQVEVDVEYQRTMLQLSLKASPRETLLGWYATSLELNSFSALIQNFFASPETGTFPHPAVHLTISTEPGKDIETHAYISAPAAVNPDRAAESCLFIEVPHRLSQGDADRSALEAIAAAANNESRQAPLVPDIEALATTIAQTEDLLERTSGYVGEILDEERDPNQALGQFMMNNLSLAPKVAPESIEHDFNNHIQDVLMVSYLANTIRTQIDLSQRLATSALTMEHKEGAPPKEGEDGKGERGERGGRGGKRGSRGGRGGGQQREPREPREPRENGE